MDMISVIVPVYNVIDTLDKCLKSICSQTYKNLEIILIDDASSDGSTEKCDGWKDKDARVSVIHQKIRGGVSQARNIGINVATGKYITFVDPDDFLEKTLYEDLVDLCSENEMVAFGYFEHMLSDKGENVEIKCTTLRSTINHREVVEENYHRLFGLSIFDMERWNRGESLGQCRTGGMVWQFIFKASVLNDNNIRFDEKITLKEDEVFVMECLIHVSKIKVVPSPYYHYVRRLNGLTYKLDDISKIKNKFDLLLAKNRIRTKINEKDGIESLELYALSNVLSIVEIFVLGKESKNRYKYYIDYIRQENVKTSIMFLKIELKNYKFMIVLLLLKCHAYMLLYLMLVAAEKIGLNPWKSVS